MMPENISTGALPSKKDKRNAQHSDLAKATTFLIKGGFDYLPQDIEHQHTVGICTAISNVQQNQLIDIQKYSPDFHYLCQKKFYDKNWTEGSSLLHSLKVAKNIGFLPRDLFPITEKDRYLPYREYIKKLQAIPDAEIERLKALCVNKISGYAQVDVKDPEAIAKAILESQGGILCRYGCQSNWWQDKNGNNSWNPKDINPLRWKKETSGHAIIMSKFDYSNNRYMQRLVNTWGTLWCLQGQADIDWSTYPPTEAWIILDKNPMFKFTQDMKLGSRGNEVKELQKRLGMPAIFQTGFFGSITKKYVIEYQKKHQLVPDGIIGSLSRAKLNN